MEFFNIRLGRVAASMLLVLRLGAGALTAADEVEHPYLGVTVIHRAETAPVTLSMHIVLVDLAADGIRFRLTPAGGTRETIRETTLGYLERQHAQVAINGHFFMPFPSQETDAFLIGLAASDGNIFSAFEEPDQSYALVANAPALNIDRSNRVGMVHFNREFADRKHVLENVTLWNTVAGSAQIVTDGVKTIPTYRTEQDLAALLTPGGPKSYSNANSWYDARNARTAIGFKRDRRTLVLFTVDRAGGSRGMPVGEVADILIHDYGVYAALNLDGGGSTTLAMEDPKTHAGKMVNVSSDNPKGRSVGSNLAVFAAPLPMQARK